MNGVRTMAAIALSACAAYQYLNDPSWYLYVPAYGLASAVCTMAFPSSTSWRILSSMAVVGGGLLMIFLTWTFYSLEDVIGLELLEAKSLLPVAAGVALTGGTRLVLDGNESLLKYLRDIILVSITTLAVCTFIYSTKYYM